MKLANPVRALLKGSVLAFICRWWIELVIAAVLLWGCFGPSIDSKQESHGFFVADGYVTGNGVLVRDYSNGKERVLFLTCRHVLTAVMLTTGRAFIDRADSDNAIYIREAGKGFRYIRFNNIDPRRWLTIDDDRFDYAWIELNDDEVKALTVNGDRLQAIDLESEVMPLDHSTFRTFPKGVQVAVTSLFAPVFGSGPPETKRYYWPRIPINFLNRYITVAHDWKASVLLINKKIKVPLEGREGIGFADRPQMVLDAPVHVNISGSPVFCYFEEDGHRKRKLVGLLDVGIGTDKSGFQTLDAILPLLRGESDGKVILLKNGAHLKVNIPKAKGPKGFRICDYPDYKIVGCEAEIIKQGTNVYYSVEKVSQFEKFRAGRTLKESSRDEFRAGDKFEWSCQGKDWVFVYDGEHWHDADGDVADHEEIPFGLIDCATLTRESPDQTQISLSAAYREL